MNSFIIREEYPYRIIEEKNASLLLYYALDLTWTQSKCIGGADDFSEPGVWSVDVAYKHDPEYVPEPNIIFSGSREQAIDSLWNHRRKAYKHNPQ